MHRSVFLFFFNDTATTEIYTLSLHDALPIWPPWFEHQIPSTPPSIARRTSSGWQTPLRTSGRSVSERSQARSSQLRSEEHTSELQSRQYLVCRLLLEKKKKHTLTVIQHYNDV